MATQIKPKSRYNAARHRAIQAGTWQRNQPAALVREHIRTLMNGPGRLRLADIADRSGVPYGTVKSLLYSNQDAVIGYVASQLLAVQDDQPGTRKLVDATGTHRRLQALARMQWSLTDVGNRLGVCVQAVSLWMSRSRVHETSAEKVRALYGELCGTLGPSPHARRRAERLGWPSPLAWDDDIDDPQAQPNLGDPDADVIDEVAVRRALEGERLTLTAAERLHAIRVGLADGMTAAEMARRLHISGSRALELVNEVRTAQAA